MNVLRAIAGEIVHLFVDDGALALALLVWSAVVGVGVAVLHDFAPIAGAVLFIGCAAILLWNAIRAAKRER